MGDPETKKSKVSMATVKSQSRTRSMAALGQKSMSRMRVRRQSYGFTGVPGIRPIERSSQFAIEFKRPPLIYLNTYQLDPHPEFIFNIPKVMKAMEETLDEHFTGHKYNVQESPAKALRMAGEIMRKVKAMQFNRYRVIAVVTIGQKRAQSYNNAISFLWDHVRDNYVDVQREETTAFIQVTTFVHTVLLYRAGGGYKSFPSCGSDHVLDCFRKGIRRVCGRKVSRQLGTVFTRAVVVL